MKLSANEAKKDQFLEISDPPVGQSREVFTASSFQPQDERAPTSLTQPVKTIKGIQFMGKNKA